MRKIITIKLPDLTYEVLYDRAAVLHKKAVDMSGGNFMMSPEDLIRNAAEMGIVSHIVQNLNILEGSLNRGKQNE